jgi:hypothetical protein
MGKVLGSSPSLTCNFFRSFISSLRGMIGVEGVLFEDEEGDWRNTRSTTSEHGLFV